jgi:DNA-binding NarL/FixJ family response regulator
MDEVLNSIRILLVDANPLFRSGIARLLDGQPDMAVVGETGDCLEAIRLAKGADANLILLDIEVNECDGPTLVRTLKRQLAGCRVVVLTNDVDPDTVLGCVLAGADGYLPKSITPDELFARIRGLTHGEAPLTLSLAAVLLQRLSQSHCTLCLRASPNPKLTPRECEVLGLVARGMTNKRIGALLNISENTVRNHLCNIYQKLNLENRLQVAVYSVTHGLVNFDTLG